MKIDKLFYDFIEEGERYEKFAYPDSGGVPTIGIGHKLTVGERASGKIVINNVPVEYRKGLDRQTALNLLNQDASKAQDAINRLVTVPLNRNQFTALVSFVFNVGVTAFRESTLLRVLNFGRYTEVPSQLKRWIYDNGVIVNGLINRRNAEIELWTRPEVTTDIY